MTATLTCCTCKQNLPETEFAWKNKATGKRHSTCKPCKRSYTQQHYADNSDGYRERNAERRRALKAEREALLRELRRQGVCACCDAKGTLTKLLHTRKAGYLGLPLHEIIRESRSKAAFNEALSGSELKCEQCAFSPYAANLKLYQFGNPARQRNLDALPA